jgi:hypothetical protein
MCPRQKDGAHLPCPHNLESSTHTAHTHSPRVPRSPAGSDVCRATTALSLSLSLSLSHSHSLCALATRKGWSVSDCGECTVKVPHHIGWSQRRRWQRVEVARLGLQQSLRQLMRCSGCPGATLDSHLRSSAHTTHCSSAALRHSQWSGRVIPPNSHLMLLSGVGGGMVVRVGTRQFV